MRVVVVLLITLASVLAGPARNGGQRVIGGDVTTIDKYPFAAAMIFEFFPQVFAQNCGGAILNEKSILSAAHCFSDEKTDYNRWRIRVGSSFASSGGQVHNAARLINHPEYNANNFNNDIAVVQLATFMVFNNVVQQATLAGPNYIPEEHDPIWSIGWGFTNYLGSMSEQLKHVQQRVFSRSDCQSGFMITITEFVLCIGSDSDNQGICVGDSGGPNLHNNVVVGVTSFTQPQCGQAGKPSGTMRVSSYIDWILDNVYTD